MFLRGTCHREICHRNIRDKRLSREACLHLGDVKVEMKRRMKTPSWRKYLKLKLGTVFLRDACHRVVYQRNSRDKRFAGEACFDLGDAEVEKDIVTVNEEEDEDTLVGEEPH